MACGPFFGIEVLSDRQNVLLAPPTVSFETELRALVPPPKYKLPVVESAGSDQPVLNRPTVEARELTPAAAAMVKTMWEQTTGPAAFAIGPSLPPGVRLYTAAAISFLHGDPNAAKIYFRNILELSEQERKTRELWARFMLGRIAMQAGDQGEAAAQFEAVRTMVRQGTPDAMGLAVASFGEQARGAWRAGAVARAVELYARQASFGSQTGANSLVIIANLIFDDPKLLDKAIQDVVARRLLFLCLNANSGRLFFFEPAPNRSAGSTVDRIAAALKRHGLTQVEGAGLLASAAYSQGRFDLAENLAALEDTGISRWVKAKLALRRGDTQLALNEYERALRFSVSIEDEKTLKAEYGILRVSRGDYVQALDVFYHATGEEWEAGSSRNGFTDYWGDAAYLAERVLTIEELKKYVDRTLPADSSSGAKSRSSHLRSLLARRLMRAGRRYEAFRYFDDLKTRHAAQEYGSAVNEANRWWYFRLARAKAWFSAARLARGNGMELLGFEREPDYAMWNGEYSDWGLVGPHPSAKDLKAANPYQSQDERNRVTASKPETDVRFQYRLTAVDHAMQSADLLPPRSQAFAAVLCEASRWIIDREPQQAEQVYRRYLRQGAYVPWGTGFGRACPEPNFSSAAGWRQGYRQVQQVAKHVHAHPATASVGGIAVIIATLLGYMRARRMRRLIDR